MKVLLVSARSPFPPYRGDRLRLSIWLEALANVEGAELTLVAPRHDDGSRAPGLEWIEPRPSIRFMLSTLFSIFFQGLPWTALLAAQYDWRRALEQAHRKHDRFDVAVILLSRTAAIVRPYVLADRVVLDAVDSLANAARARAEAASRLTRRLWLLEVGRLERLERSEWQWDLTTVVSREESGLFGGEVEVLQNGVDFDEPARAEETFDFGFWGRLGFFANADAARWILEEIWPAILRKSPSANLLIAGVDASPSLRRLAQQKGVTLRSPAPDLPRLRSGVRVAIMPLRYGSGQPNKILEAVAAGCAVVTTPRVARCFPDLAGSIRSGSNADEIIYLALDLADDELRRCRIADRMREIATVHYDRAITIRRMQEIVRGPNA